MLGINLRCLEIVGGGSSAGDASISEALSKNSRIEAEVTRHGKTVNRIQCNSMLTEKVQRLEQITIESLY
jgi:hypothetical protein